MKNLNRNIPAKNQSQSKKAKRNRSLDKRAIRCLIPDKKARNNQRKVRNLSQSQKANQTILMLFLAQSVTPIATIPLILIPRKRRKKEKNKRNKTMKANKRGPRNRVQLISQEANLKRVKVNLKARNLELRTHQPRAQAKPREAAKSQVTPRNNLNLNQNVIINSHR